MSIGQINSIEQAALWAAQCLRRFGHPDAVPLLGTAGYSADVQSSSAFGRIYFDAFPVDLAMVESLVADAGVEYHRTLYCFSRSGYAAPSVRYADQLGVALFTYGPQGGINAETAAAQLALDRSYSTGTAGGSGWLPYESPVAPAVTAPLPPVPVIPAQRGGWFRRSMRWLGRLFRSVAWESFRSDEPHRPADLMTGGQLTGAGVGVSVFGIVGVISMLSELGGPRGVAYALSGAATYGLVVLFGIWAAFLGRRRKKKDSVARDPDIFNPTDLR